MKFVHRRAFLEGCDYLAYIPHLSRWLINNHLVNSISKSPDSFWPWVLGCIHTFMQAKHSQNMILFKKLCLESVTGLGFLKPERRVGFPISIFLPGSISQLFLMFQYPSSKKKFLSICFPSPLWLLSQAGSGPFFMDLPNETPVVMSFY